MPLKELENTRDDPNINYGVLPTLLGYLVRRATTYIFSDFTTAMGDFDLVPGEFGLLALIRSNPGLTQNRLAEAANLSKSTITPVLHRFEKRGLIARVTVKTDRRHNSVSLTDEGEEFYQRSLARILEHEDGVAAHLTAEERQIFAILLRKLVSSDVPPRAPAG